LVVEVQEVPVQTQGLLVLILFYLQHLLVQPQEILSPMAAAAVVILKLVGCLEQMEVLVVVVEKQIPLVHLLEVVDHQVKATLVVVLRGRLAHL
jgi:hypothetical protein